MPVCYHCAKAEFTQYLLTNYKVLDIDTNPKSCRDFSPRAMLVLPINYRRLQIDEIELSGNIQNSIGIRQSSFLTKTEALVVY